MSDEDDFMMSDAESYEFEFEDDEGEDQEMEASGVDEDEHSPEVLYYQAKNVKQDDQEGALKLFTDVFGTEGDGTDVVEYKFKSLKQILKVLYKLDRADEMSDWLNKLLALPLNKLQKSYVEDSFSKMLDSYTGLPSEEQLHFLETFLDKYRKSDRLMIKAWLKKIAVLLEMHQLDRILGNLKMLYERLETMPEMTKNAYLLELYAVEIQAYSEKNDIPKLKELYKKTLSIQSTIPHPRINAVVKECGGKMHLRDEEYELASDEFYESFRNYDEVGNQKKRIQVLKYLIISSILNNNEINKFESQETKYFLKDEEILKYVKLVHSFEELDNKRFAQLHSELLNTEKSDPFMTQTLGKVESVLKLKMLIHYIKPFKRLTLEKLSRNLRISSDDIEDIFLKLRNNGEVTKVRLDLVDGIIYNE